MNPVAANAIHVRRGTSRQHALLFALMGCAPLAQAQGQDAGNALREAMPAPAPRQGPPQAPPLPTPPAPAPAVDAKSQATFVLNAVTFSGNTRYASAQLAALMQDQIGRRVTLADLQVLAERVTARYHQDAYVLTRTVVPPQDVSNGQVAFSVLEGRLGRVRVERLDDVPVRDGLVEGIVARLPTDRPLTHHELERAVLMLSDLPGVASQAALETGDAAGTYDLVIELKAAPRTSFSADLDNQGSRATGEVRIGASVRANSPLRRGDNLDLRLLTSFDKGLHFGRLSYETPVGTRGWRASAAYGRVQYDLGKDFAVLDAYGSADVVELAASYPVLRSRNRNLFVRLGAEAKRLEDHVGAVDLVSNKRTHSLTLGLVYEARDGLLGGGYTSAGLNLYGGDLSLRSPDDLALDQGPFGRATDGRFVRLGYNASRLQALGPTLSAYVALAGQQANRNLDSADRIAIGGPRAVRAYSSATGIGDEGAIANVELRWSVAPSASLSAFYDIGRVRINRRSTIFGADNHRTLAGPGIALYWTVLAGAALRASVAWPQRGAGPAATRHDQRSPRAYAQLVKMF